MAGEADPETLAKAQAYQHEHPDVTRPELASEVGVSLRTLRRWIEQGHLSQPPRKQWTPSASGKKRGPKPNQELLERAREYRRQHPGTRDIEVARAVGVWGAMVQRWVKQGLIPGRVTLDDPRVTANRLSPSQELEQIECLVERLGGKASVARRLGVVFSTLYRWMGSEGRTPQWLLPALRGLVPELPAPEPEEAPPPLPLPPPAVVELRAVDRPDHLPGAWALDDYLVVDRRQWQVEEVGPGSELRLVRRLAAGDEGKEG